MARSRSAELAANCSSVPKSARPTLKAVASIRRKARRDVMWELYATETFLQVLLVTGAIGGAAVRFVHFALFEADLLALLSYIVDTLFLLAVASLSFRISRTSQMVTQYPWLYERTGLLSWRARAAK